jgi:1-acyl-sn-glycerol-3-phosphate acyltransferase
MNKRISIYYQKTCYGAGWLLCNALGSLFLKPKIYGKENIPKESAILVASHATNLDGLFISMFIKKQIHFWIQYENVYEKNPKLLDSIGEIPVKVKEIDIKFWKDITLYKSLFYLKNTNDLIGVFPEGPAALTNNNKVYRGAVNLACKYNEKYGKTKKIVPGGLWVHDEDKKRLEKYGSGVNLKKGIEIISENISRKIQYHALFGEAIEIKNFSPKEQKELARYLLKECNSLVNIIKNSSPSYI